MLRLLFVCTGNTCRSPMAEALFRSELINKPPPLQVKASSAGLKARTGDKASPDACKLLLSEGIEYLKNHRAVRVNGEIIAGSDLILVMTKDQKSLLLQKYPRAQGKTFVLKEYVFPKAGKFDIPDPLDLGMEKYRQVLKEIRTCITKLYFLVGESR